MVLGGGLEPDFRGLFSAIFHGAFLGNFHQGRNLRKWAEAKVWHFVADLHTKFLCVLVVLCLSTVIAQEGTRSTLRYGSQGGNRDG